MGDARPQILAIDSDRAHDRFVLQRGPDGIGGIAEPPAKLGEAAGDNRLEHLAEPGGSGVVARMHLGYAGDQPGSVAALDADVAPIWLPGSFAPNARA